MYKFIGMEDLVANALIEMIEKNYQRRVSFEQLGNYGTVIMRWFHHTGEEVVLLVSKYYTNELIRNYSDFFEVFDDSETDSYIELKETKTAEDLRAHFRSYLSVDMLMAFTAEENLRELNLMV